jgi:hypothetical protein
MRICTRLQTIHRKIFYMEKRMNGYIAIAVAGLLAGCVTTPVQLMETGVRVESPLKLAPRDAAGCIARNAEKRVCVTCVSSTRAGPGGSEEIFFRSLDTASTVAVVRVHPAKAGIGSIAETWTAADRYADRFRVALMEGC